MSAPIDADLAARLRRAGLEPVDVSRLVTAALAEDLAGGTDITTQSIIGPRRRGRAELVARADGVVAGLPVAEAVFVLAGHATGEPADQPVAEDPAGRPVAEDLADGPATGETAEGLATGKPDRRVRTAGGHAVTVSAAVADGDRVTSGTVLLTVAGSLSTILTAERTALNLLCHLSGIATLTRQWADAISGTGARVRDTRKTLPGMRALQKYAVRCGGGLNHRMSLADAALIKDNHVAAAGSVTAALAAVTAAQAAVNAAQAAVTAAQAAASPARQHPDDRRNGPATDRAAAGSQPIEVECDTLAQVTEALAAGAELILLDNFTVPELAAAVAATAGRARLEASGGLTLGTAAEVAATGVDYLAVGALTHSAPALDIGLDLVHAE